jgi:dynein heavy chain
LKAFAAPPAAVAKVAQAVLVLFSPKGKVPKDKSWKACKVMMGGADQFLSNLRNYDKENIHPEVVKAIKPFIDDKGLQQDKIINIVETFIYIFLFNIYIIINEKIISSSFT